MSAVTECHLSEEGVSPSLATHGGCQPAARGGHAPARCQALAQRGRHRLTPRTRSAQVLAPSASPCRFLLVPRNAALGPLLPGSPQGQHPPGSVCLPARIVGAVSPRRPAVCSSARGRPHIPVTLRATCPSVFGSPVPAHRMPSLAGILYALKWDCLNTRFKIMTFHSLNFVWYFLMKNKSSSNNFKTNEFQILFYSIPHLKSWHLLRCSLDGSFS